MKSSKKVFHIYLFRHGQTTYNEKKIFTGWKDAKLTKNGVNSAKIIGKKLKDKKIQAAFHTRLSRSKDTLKEVLKYHPECQIIIEDDRMIERSYGNLQGIGHKKFIEKEGTDYYKTLLHWHKIDNLNGKERQEFIKKIGEAELKIIRRSYEVAPPRGESIKMVEKRVNRFVKDLLVFIKKNKVNVAISAHGNSMRPFRRYFEKASINEMMDWEMPYDNYFVYDIRA